MPTGLLIRKRQGQQHSVSWVTSNTSHITVPEFYMPDGEMVFSISFDAMTDGVFRQTLHTYYEMNVFGIKFGVWIPDGMSQWDWAIRYLLDENVSHKLRFGGSMHETEAIHEFTHDKVTIHPPGQHKKPDPLKRFKDDPECYEVEIEVNE